MTTATPTRTRTLSHTELQTLTECFARWDLTYSDALAGSSLHPKVTAPILREGRAWGAAVAAWHATGSVARATEALTRALDDDADRMIAAGTFDRDEYTGMRAKLDGILQHYTATASRLPIDSPEHEFDVTIPSRTGRRASNRYRLQGRFDGLHTDSDGRMWIAEFKLRRTLSTLDSLVLDRQGRRYAWAWWRATGQMVAGVIYDETLNQAPQAPRILASGKTSSDKRQHTTADWYLASCADTGATPVPETVDALRSRLWQQRHRIIFRPGELDDTGRELVSLARLVHDLEAGRITPVRAPSARRCPGCPYRDICPDPTDTPLVDAAYVRAPAKRDRNETP